jgi:biopolymer transport protein ExbD
MVFEFRRRSRASIDIAPLVDVVFNLLLFFIVTYNIAPDAAIQVKLPESTTAESHLDEPLVITLTREGTTFVGTQPVSIEDIPMAISGGMGSVRPSSINIRADQEAAVGLLIKVVDAVRMSGCTTFNIRTSTS